MYFVPPNGSRYGIVHVSIFTHLKDCGINRFHVQFYVDGCYAKIIIRVEVFNLAMPPV